MGLGFGMPCCCGGDSPCSVCNGTAPSLQATISGFSQTNTPVEIPSPPCACTSLNQTIALGVGACGDAGNTCTGVIYASAWSFEPSPPYECYIEGTQQGLDMTVNVQIYPNGSGGTDVFAEVALAERDDLDGLNYSRLYYGTATLDADNETIDCSTIDITISLSSLCVNIEGSDVWCGGSISLQLEAI